MEKHSAIAETAPAPLRLCDFALKTSPSRANHEVGRRFPPYGNEKGEKTATKKIACEGKFFGEIFVVRSSFRAESCDDPESRRIP